MSDRELLGLAAKACGWVRYGPNEFDPKVECVTWLDLETGEPHWSDMWNPLANDGDALRLAVKLDMMVDTVNRVVVGYLSDINVDIDFDEQEKDQYAATRRAIVRAAAEIGKAMP